MTEQRVQQEGPREGQQRARQGDAGGAQRPAGRVYFAADVHLGGGDAEEARRRERHFVAWLDRAAADAEAIYLLGDLFDFWFEYRRVVPKGFLRPLAKLAELTARGIRIVFFTGNHDQWVRDYLASACGVEIRTRPQLVELHGRQIYLAHGHDMGLAGEPRLLNRIFRSGLLRRLFAWGVHPDLALKFGHWWSSQSRKAHLRKGPVDPAITEPLIGFARDYARTHRVDHFVFGHLHVARDYREGSLHTLHLGAWDGPTAACAVLEPDGTLTLETFAS